MAATVQTRSYGRSAVAPGCIPAISLWLLPGSTAPLERRTEVARATRRLLHGQAARERQVVKCRRALAPGARPDEEGWAAADIGLSLLDGDRVSDQVWDPVGVPAPGDGV